MPDAAPGVVSGAIVIDPALLTRAAHDLRSPLTVLLCNRRFLQEILAKAGLDDDDDVREILEDDANALARLEQGVANLDVLARGIRAS